MKLGIIGTGKIVHEALYAMEELDQIQKKAIFARPHSKAKGEELAKKYGIDQVYTDYDKLLDEAEIDAVYIGLVNSAHYPYAKQALLAGKHVILEKPLVSTVLEAEDLAKTAREKGCYLLEAITVMHGEIYDKMKEMLPLLGEIKVMQCNYSQYSSRYDNYLKGKVEPAFDPDLSGGALYDINLYNIYYSIGLLGSPMEAVYYPNRGFNGIDTSGFAVLSYPGFHAVCTGAKDSDSPSFICVQGDKGWMRINGKPNVPATLDVEYFDVEHPEGIPSPSGGISRAMIRETITPQPVRHRMTTEFMDFARIIDDADKDAAEESLERSLAVIQVLESARKHAGIHFGVDDKVCE